MKVGIYAPWANGDMIMSTPFLKYREELWPGANIIWFVLPPENAHAAGLHRASPDIVAHNPYIDEVRASMSSPGEMVKARVGHRTNEHGHPLSVGIDEAGRIKDDSRVLPELSDLDLCYFPAPTHNCDKLGTPFTLITKFVFKYPEGAVIHPCLFFTKEEDGKAESFVGALPHKYTIMLETEYGSGQSHWNDDLTRDCMRVARSTLGFCNFVFASPKSCEKFRDDAGVVDCSGFSIRQCIPIFNRCNLFIGVGSGISHAVGSWTASPVRRIDCTNGTALSTSYTSIGPCSNAFRREDFMPLLVNELDIIRRR